MNPTKLTVLFLLCGLCIIRAQTLPNAIQWKNLYGEKSAPPVQYLHTYIYYFVKGDSTLNSNIYKKIYRTTKYCGNATEGLGSPCNSVAHGPVSLAGLLRDTGQEWYFRKGGKERLLYSFIMLQGDTLYDWTDSSQFVIIDTVITNYNNTGRKFFKVKNIPGYISNHGIIEQVGPTCGFLSFLFFPHEQTENLNCYSFLYNNDCVPWKDLISALPEQNPDRAFTTIYPNPASLSLQIKLNNSERHNSLRIYNGLGQIVLQQESVSDGQIIEINHLNQGIYFAEITGQNKSRFVLVKE